MTRLPSNERRALFPKSIVCSVEQLAFCRALAFISPSLINNFLHFITSSNIAHPSLLFLQAELALAVQPLLSQLLRKNGKASAQWVV
jgi:uroporphyrinogen-III synthase